MKIENQFCSLELARRLKELGVEQEGIFCWAKQSGFKKFGIELYSSDAHLQRTGTIYYVAFTVAELGEILSKGQGFFDSGFRRVVGASNWSCAYFEGFKPTDKVHSNFGDNEADARARMLIYLLENGIIKNE